MNDLQNLILRGMKGVFNVSDKVLLDELARGVRTCEYRLFYVKYTAFCIVMMPQKPLETPQVMHFYTEKPALRRALAREVLDFVKSKGYNKLRAINNSGAPDPVWVRAFRQTGWEIKPVKTVFDFEVVKNG